MGAEVVQNERTGNRRRRRRARPMSEINVTPFVDVMLVLLIIFMVAAPLQTVGVPVELPRTAAQALASGQEEPLTVTLTASQESAAVGQEIRFRYESRGTNLSQTVVEYGNGDLETVPFIYTGGAPVNINSQAGHFDYAYEEPGTYVARATVSTVAGDSRSAMVTVQISGP